MNVSLKIDAKKVTKLINSIATKQLRFASKEALNTMAFEVKDEEVIALDKHLDRPTPFTKRAYEVKRATPASLRSTVHARPIQAEYLKFQVDGGARSPKGRANVLPVGVKLNTYGNMPQGAVAKMIASKKFFHGTPKGGGVAGIYQRLGSTKTNKKGLRNQRIRLMVAYEGSVKYRERLPFFETASVKVAKRWEYIMRKELAKAIAGAR